MCIYYNVNIICCASEGWKGDPPARLFRAVTHLQDTSNRLRVARYRVLSVVSRARRLGVIARGQIRYTLRKRNDIRRRAERVRCSPIKICL